MRFLFFVKSLLEDSCCGVFLLKTYYGQFDLCLWWNMGKFAEFEPQYFLKPNFIPKENREYPTLEHDPYLYHSRC